MILVEYILSVTAILLLLSIIASKTSERLGIPVLILFMLIGMLSGSQGPGGIYFNDPDIAQLLGIVALTLIIFFGGLSTDWRNVQPVLFNGLALSTIGVFITALLVGLFASWLLGFSLLEGLLLGGIVSSTDAAAVFAVLRSNRVRLKGDLKPLLEFESGSNDPMAVFITVGLIFLLENPRASIAMLFLRFFQQFILGLAIGIVMGHVIIFMINRLRLEYEGLYSVLTVSLVLLTYGVTTILGGSGFLAAYIAGIVMGNNDFIHKRSLLYFHDGLAWLMQIAMFLTMGLLVFPSRLLQVAVMGIAISLFLMIIARPLSVFLALIFSRFDVREKMMISWIGLRGAAPIILATFPLTTGIGNGETIFNIVFFIVLASVLLQGTSIPYIARLLRVDAPLVSYPRCPIQSVPISDLHSDMVELEVQENSPASGKPIIDIGLPKGVLIVLINRNGNTITPHGGTILEAGDILLVLAKKEDLDRVCSLMEAEV